MIECQSCGHQNPDGAQFCEQCHVFLEWQGGKRVERPPSGITAAIERGAGQVTPGAQAEVRVRVRNTGAIVDEFRLEVVGDAAAWATVEPAVVRLFPSTSEVARIVFAPPRSPDVAAGPVRYGLKATSTVRPDVYTVENDLLDVAPFVEWSADLVPPRPRGEGAARVQVRVRNRGNTPLQVAVSARSPEDALVFDGAPASVTVPPGQMAGPTLQLSAHQPAAVGTERSHPFQVVVESLEGREVTLDGTLLELGPAPRVEWYARLVPPTLRADASADYRLQVSNRGQVPVTLGLQAQDPAGALLFQLSTSSLTVAPGAEQEALLRATPAQAMGRGSERPLPFRVAVTGGDRQAYVDGMLVQVPPAPVPGAARPHRRRWGCLALAGLLLVALVAGTVVVANGGLLGGGGPSGGGGGGGGGGNGAQAIQVAVLDEIGTSRCETFESVDVVIDGKDRGTLTVDNTGRTDQTLQATVSGPGSHTYQLTANARFDVRGRQFQLRGGGSGSIAVSAAAHSFSVEVDESVLPLNQCPAANGRWPLLLRAH